VKTLTSKLRYRGLYLVGLLVMALAASGCRSGKRLPAPTHHAGKPVHLDVPQSDGVKLHTVVRIPKGDGPFPTLLYRAPYPLGAYLNPKCRYFNRHGYACAWQHVRGRHRSEGEWLPFVNETADGRDTINWMAKQDWCDGNIALLGASYLGAAAWSVADEPPPELKTIIPTVVGTDIFALFYEGGLFRHDIGTAWMSLMPGPDFRYLSGSRHYHRALRHRPRIEMDLVSGGEEFPWFRAWQLSDRRDAPFWQQDFVQRAEEIPAQTQVPVLSIAGWSDAFTGTQIETFRELATKEESTLVIGPWDHLSNVAASVRQRGLNDDIGLWGSYGQQPRVLDWLGHHLRGEPTKYPVGAVVSYVVNGEGWTVHEEWPPPSEPFELAFAPGEDPQRCTGALTIAKSTGTVSWDYDPARPTPSHGGAGVLAGSFPLWRGAEPGFLKQGRLCERRDDLIGFVSEPLSEPLHVAGNLHGQLKVKTSAPDTAFNIRFLEQRSNGARIHVRETILALSARPDNEPYEAGSAVTIDLETWPVEYVFEAGSRILIEVGSSSFPKYEAHSNTTEHWALAVETPVAKQHLILEGSSISLPEIVE
jgi:uncharacterized protein